MLLYDFDTEDKDQNWSVVRGELSSSPMLGGSEAATVMGLNRFESPRTLMLKKLGIRDGIFRHTYNMDVGHALEPLIIQSTEKDLGILIRSFSRTYVHDQYPFMIANFDGVSDCGRLVECKTTNDKRKVDLVKDGHVPEDWFSQIQHYMAFQVPWGRCVGEPFKEGILSVMTSFSKPIIIKVPNDLDFQEELILKEERFVNHMKSGSIPEPDGSESSAEEIFSIPIKAKGELEPTQEQLERYNKYKSLKKINEESKKELEACRQLFRMEMGTDNTKIRGICQMINRTSSDKKEVERELRDEKGIILKEIEDKHKKSIWTFRMS